MLLDLRVQLKDINAHGVYRPLDSFKEPGVNDQVATLRFNHYQKKRILKLGQIDMMIRNLNAPKSPYRTGMVTNSKRFHLPNTFVIANSKQEAALRKAFDPTKKNDIKSSMSNFSEDLETKMEKKATKLKSVSMGIS